VPVAGKGFQIAEGYLDITADTDHALRDVRAFFKEVDGELTAEEKAFRKSGESSGKNWSEGVAVGLSGKSLQPMRKLLEDVDRDSKLKAKEIGEHTVASLVEGAEHDAARQGSRIGRLFERLLGSTTRRRRGGGLLAALLPGGSGGASRLFSGLMSGASKFFSTFAQGFADAVSTGAQQAQQAFKTLSGVFSQIGSIAGGIGSVLQIGLWAALIPVVLGLAGALLQFSAVLLLIPGAIGVLIAAIAPLMIALHGFGEAISAGLSGDVDKFNEALKKLAPNARKVAKEIVGLKPLLSQLKNSVQEAFFGPLVGQVAKLGNTLLPVLWVGLSHVAGALGRIAAGFANLLSSPAAVKGINDLFMTTERILDRIGPSLIQLFGGIGALVQASLPWVERLFGLLADGMSGLAGWLSQISSDGTLNAWLTRAWDIGKKLWAVLQGLGEFAVILLSSFGDEGTDTLNGMADAIAKVNTYLKSKEGQETLHNLGVLVHWAGDAFVALVGATVSAYQALNAVFSFIRGIGPFFKELGHDIADMGRAIWQWATDLWGAVSGAVATAWHAITGFVSDTGSAIGGWFSSLWSSIVSGGAAVLAWLAALPGQIWSFLTAIPGMIANLNQQLYDTFLFGIGYVAGLLVKFWTVDLPGWIQSGWAWAVAYVEEGASRTWTRIAALPGQIWGAMVQVGNIIKTTFLDAWHWAVAYAEEGAWRTWTRIMALPGQIWSALSSLGSAIGGQMQAAWNWAVSAVSNGYNAVMGWIHSLPGAIRSAFSGAAGWLVGAGRDILHGLVNGIEDTLSWAVGVARAAAQRIKDGFLSALGISSPSKVMRMEVGRWILPGVMQGIEDTQPRFDKYLGATADMISGGFNPTVNVAAPNVSVGGTTLIADLGEGIRQVVPIMITKNPRAVAAAGAVGTRQRTGWVNTGRTGT
jgi:phage-related protein